MGSLDYPFNPLSLAIGAEASFVARAIDTDRKHLTEILRRAAGHKGTAFVEIYQNCNIFNDGAFDFVREEEENRIYLEHGKLVEATGFVHDEHAEDPAQAFALAKLADSPNDPTPIGVFRAVDRPVGIAEVSRKLAEARAGTGSDALERLLHAGDTWTVSG
jgi:2-oxoglutarate ferredoxin oxidoreductase subunit beta